MPNKHAIANAENILYRPTNEPFIPVCIANVLSPSICRNTIRILDQNLFNIKAIRGNFIAFLIKIALFLNQVPIQQATKSKPHMLVKYRQAYFSQIRWSKIEVRMSFPPEVSKVCLCHKTYKTKTYSFACCDEPCKNAKTYDVDQSSSYCWI